MNKNLITFGQVLKKLRKDKKLTLNKLAELAGLSPSYLSRVERGQRNTPNPFLLKKLAPHLGLTNREILIAAGYLTEEPANKVFNNEFTNGPHKESAAYWKEIIRDPAFDEALQEIGPLSPDEKEGLLIYLKAIKLKRQKDET